MRAQALYEAGWLASDDRDNNQAQLLSEQSLAYYRELGDKGGMAMAINTLGWTAYNLSDYAQAKLLADESLTLFRETGLKFKFADALNLLGVIAYTQGNYDQAVEFYEECLKWSREIGDKPPAAHALSLWGYAEWLQGNLEEAAALTEEGLRLAREVRLDWNVADGLNQLGDIARAEGKYDKAAKLYEECFLIYERLGNPSQRSYLLVSQSKLMRLQGNHAEAIGLFREALVLWREMGDKRHIAECLEGLAGVGADLGNAELSAKLMGMAELIREETSSPMPLIDHENYDRDVVTIRSLLGQSNFRKIWAAGRALTLEQAIDEAYRIISTKKASMPLTENLAKSQEWLNERELEILRLIAKGLSNHEIAERLVLAVSTVKWYINNIFAKLHVRNRTEAVARARELKLL
jgi:ATP/maltotriose-dependent transcriptional regulator MalT